MIVTIELTEELRRLSDMKKESPLTGRSATLGAFCPNCNKFLEYGMAHTCHYAGGRRLLR